MPQLVRVQNVLVSRDGFGAGEGQSTDASFGHAARPSFTLADTTFHFIDATPAEALRQAKDAAEGKDVRVGGGVATVREFFEADLLDTIHVAVAPMEIGSGQRLWTSHEDLIERYHVESVPSPSGVTHLLFWRR